MLYIEGVTKIVKRKDFYTRQAEHLEKVKKLKEHDPESCLHNQCTQCVGTGIKVDGTPCVHMISCRCSKCTP